MDDAERDELKAKIAELESELGKSRGTIYDLECELYDARDDISSLERDIAALELNGPPLNVTQGHIIALRDTIDGKILTRTQKIELREILDFIKGL